VFGLGVVEITVILVVALLVLGPKRLPDAARSMGRSLAEFRRASNEIRNALVLEGSAQAGPPMGTAYGSDSAQDGELSESSESESGGGGGSGGAGEVASSSQPTGTPGSPGRAVAAAGAPASSGPGSVIETTAVRADVPPLPPTDGDAPSAPESSSKLKTDT